MFLEDKLISYIKDNIAPHGDSYSYRVTKKGKHAVRVGSDLSGGWDYESREYIFTDEELIELGIN